VVAVVAAAAAPETTMRKARKNALINGNTVITSIIVRSDRKG
jgi:hypothetical protein